MFELSRNVSDQMQLSPLHRVRRASGYSIDEG